MPVLFVIIAKVKPSPYFSREEISVMRKRESNTACLNRSQIPDYRQIQWCRLLLPVPIAGDMLTVATSSSSTAIVTVLAVSDTV